eukprot:GGOE01014776.1.p1 GENE.GGOE01014776.1~~GGOE01014776.1.p1  ORF type:complete len:980 (+),score=325.02 GGOE01014776.1:112-3051(+)
MADGDCERDVVQLQREKDRAVAQLREATISTERTRKVLDTLMQDSTSFHMSARVRPFSENELARRSYSIVNSNVQENTVELLEVRNDGTLKVHFDDVFDSMDANSPKFASQELVYTKVGKPLLDFAFQGFNATLLGFGQTSSGKTYTLVGDNVDRGIVPRFMTDLFTFIAKQQEANPDQTWKVELDALEVYNERIYNLLEGIISEDGHPQLMPRPVRVVNPPKSRFSRGTFADIERDTKSRTRPNSNSRSTTPQRMTPRPGSLNSGSVRGGSVRGSGSRSSTPAYTDPSATILSSTQSSTHSSTRTASPSRRDSNTVTRQGSRSVLKVNKDIGAPEPDLYPIKGGIVVPYYIANLQPILVTNVNKMFHLLAITQQNKTVAETKMNRVSSRAHTLYRIYLTRTQHDRTVRSTISLVDLAGSENIKQSNAQGVNATEAISINKSLTVLAHCLSLRAANSKVKPPYNSCTLTKLLKETLDGNARTHMVITLSPSDSNLAATQAALRFALTCKKVRTRPTCNLESSMPLQEHLKRSIEELQTQLEEEEGRNDELKAKIAELQDFIDEEKRRMEMQAGPSHVALRKFLTSQEKVLMAVEGAYFNDEEKFLEGRNGKRDARNYYLQLASEIAEKGDKYEYTLEEMDPTDDTEVYRMLSDVFQWSCTSSSAEFLLYRMQFNVTKVERVHNARLRSDFYSCKAGLRLPHCKSVLRFYGGPIEDLDDTLRHGYSLPDPKKFNDFGVGIPFSTNAAKAALSTAESVNQLLVSEVALGSSMSPGDAARIGLHSLTPEVVQRRGYDSVHATCGRTLLEDEYIVFQARQAIPAFVVTYSIEEPRSIQANSRIGELETANAALQATVKRLRAELEQAEETLLLQRQAQWKDTRLLCSVGINTEGSWTLPRATSTDSVTENTATTSTGTDNSTRAASSTVRQHDMGCGPMEPWLEHRRVPAPAPASGRPRMTSTSATDTDGLRSHHRSKECALM